MGPSGGLERILTHDFVHRMHLEIFKGAYYPVELVDWYMDDWISVVYGSKRTIKASEFWVTHHTTHHGQRYQANRNNQRKLGPLIKSGRNAIANFADEKGYDKRDIILNDKYPPPYNDLPSE